MTERSFGWKKQKPDSRDFKISQFNITAPASLPTKADLRAGMPPIQDQGSLGSCTANAGAAIVDYCQKKAGHPFLTGSRLLLYYNTRVLVEGEPATEDTGCTIRGTLKSLAKYGICKEATWPYDVGKFSKKPSTVAIKEAADYQALKYISLDAGGISGQTLLQSIKTQVAAGLPVDFGFNVYESYGQTEKNGGCFPYPAKGEALEGGHSVVIVGYDDAKAITNTKDGSKTTGAFLIRNSWGTVWGEAGYGWLPYNYVLKGKASDFWVLLSEEWQNA